MEDERLEHEVRVITQGADLENITIKDVRRGVEESLGIVIEDKDAFSEIVKRVLSDGGVEVNDEAEAIDIEPPVKKSRGGGLKTKKYYLSPPLREFMESDMETRPQVVKRLWVYIKEHNLQEEADKRKIRLDETLEAIFGIKAFTMFSMQKILSKHLKTKDDGEPFDLTLDDEDYGTIAKPDPEKRKLREAKRGTRRFKKKRRKPGPDAKPNGFKKPIRVSPLLRDFMGADMCSRGDVVKKLWVYIKSKDLQNPENRKEILCDDTLRNLFQHDVVTTFTMNKYIQPHFLKDEVIVEAAE